jgi:hypothetical protein
MTIDCTREAVDVDRFACCIESCEHRRHGSHQDASTSIPPITSLPFMIAHRVFALLFASACCLTSATAAEFDCIFGEGQS